MEQEKKEKVDNTELYLLANIWLMLLVACILMFNGKILWCIVPFTILGLCAFKLDATVNSKLRKKKLKEETLYKEVSEWH